MTLTKQDGEWFQHYEELPQEQRDTIEAWVDSLQYAMREDDVKTPGDDRAVALTAAIARYFIESEN